MRRAGALAALVVLALAGAPARAHELRPALLDIVEVAPAEYRVELHRSLDSGFQSLTPIFPAGAQTVDGPQRTRALGRSVDRFHVRIPGGWEGKPVAVHVSGAGDAEVLVRVQSRDGRVVTGRLVPGRGDWIVPREAGRLTVARTYLTLGVEHILTGLDHLAFVLGLVLLTPAWRHLWKSVTAFTAAHSLTLALAALGIVRIPQPPVEAVIALSILFVAREAARATGPSGTGRPVWPVAFAFGLLHGLGFAGALAQVGLPAGELPLALLTFNLGVELGQLAFVAAVLALAHPLARLATATNNARLRLVPAYAIGALAFAWCLERIAAFWS